MKYMYNVHNNVQEIILYCFRAIVLPFNINCYEKNRWISGRKIIVYFISFLINLICDSNAPKQFANILLTKINLPQRTNG